MKISLMTLILANTLVQPAFAKTTSNIDAEIRKLLAHNPELTNVFAAEERGFNRGGTRAQPWSGSYWPDITGSIANHYRDRTTLGNQIGFLLRYDISKGRFLSDFKDVSQHYLSWDENKRNKKTSPSEKYDLLVGNQNFEFTRAILDELEFRSEHKKSWVSAQGDATEVEGDDNHEASRFDEDKRAAGQYVYKKKGGGFPYWSGICDGWSPASIFLPRPVHPVTVTGAQGLPITFYPDDIKALGTYLFARTNTPYFATMQYSFVGSACREKGKPSRDDHGFVRKSACNDVDAGLWHLTLLNRLGSDQTGFVMDVDNNQKINNHPVFAYELSYFNPKTGKPGSLKDSVVARSQIVDPYARFRDGKSVSIVGVRSKIKYSYYIWAEDHRDVEVDSTDQDKVKELEYTYDLELDADGKILGGEWGNRSKEDDDSVRYAKQPDFIWMAPLKQLPYSQMSSSTLKGDYVNGNFIWAWDGKSAIPEDWIAAAQEDQKWFAPELNDPYSKLKSAEPLSNLVYKLFELSQ
jgi:hypothetical protein